MRWADEPATSVTIVFGNESHATTQSACGGCSQGGQLLGQGTAGSAPAKSPDAAKNPWAYNLTVDGYIIPNDQSYVDPVFTADRNWLHLEARYNYENLRTGSLWAGYNFSAGKKLVLNVTPMIGGVFGRSTGIAPGCEASLTYKKVQLSISNEYVFDTTHKSGNFYYAWPELTYSPLRLVSRGPGGGTYQGFPHQPRRAAGFLVGVSISSGSSRRTSSIRALRIRPWCLRLG